MLTRHDYPARSRTAAALLLLAMTACSSPAEAPCPRFDVSDTAPELLMMLPYVVSEAERTEALTGSFTIRGQVVTLQVPVDWLQDPFDNRSWRLYLHALDPLKPLLYHYRETGEGEALQRALELALDWIAQNPRGGEGLSEFAWYDLAVAYRGVRLSYLYRALEHEGMLIPQQRDVLGCAITHHARWLAAAENYKPSHNHGLYEDIALFAVARQLDLHPEAPGWRAKAAERFVANLSSTVSAEGMHLEHSPTYHSLITELVGHLVHGLGMESAELAGLHDAMTAAASWLVMPDGRYPQLGDTGLGPAAPWAAAAEADHRGFAAFPDAGAAIYRDAASFFMTIAWYHSPVHKHSDELSFVWAEQGRRVIVDSGRYGYFYDEPGRIYAESSPAHNTLTLDPPFAWADSEPHGSGVLDSLSAGGWHGVLAENPQLAARHRRVFAYRPGRWLVVVDQLDQEPCPTSTRWFHFAPDLAVAELEDGAARLADSAGSVWWQAASAPVLLRAIRGQMEPEVQGFTFPSDRTWVENTTLAAVDDRCDEPLVVVLSVGEQRPLVEAVTAPGEVALVLDGEPVSITFFGDVLGLTAAP